MTRFMDCCDNSTQFEHHDRCAGGYNASDFSSVADGSPHNGLLLNGMWSFPPFVGETKTVETTAPTFEGIS